MKTQNSPSSFIFSRLTIIRTERGEAKTQYVKGGVHFKRNNFFPLIRSTLFTRSKLSLFSVDAHGFYIEGSRLSIQIRAYAIFQIYIYTHTPQKMGELNAKALGRVSFYREQDIRARFRTDESPDFSRGHVFGFAFIFLLLLLLALT